MRAILTSPRATRLLAPLAAAAALAMPAEASARIGGASATHRVSTSSRSCSRASKHGRRAHGAGRRGCKRSHTHRRGAHKRSSTSRKSAAAAPVELVAATCEDGTLPRGGAGSYACEDGSAPGCEQGRLEAGTASSAPMCAIKPSEKEIVALEGQIEPEYPCEDAAEASGPQSCEAGTEQEAIEEEE